MRIAIVAGPHVPIPPPRYGGTEQVIHYLIKGLKEAGHEPILLAPADSTEECELIPTVKEALYFPRKKVQLDDFQVRLRQAEEVTETELRRILPRVDIIHSHGFDLKNFQDFPNLTTIHGNISFNDLQYYLLRKNLYYVSISKNQQGTYPDLQYIGVVYNGENPAEFPLVAEPDDYVCFIGRFDRDKNPHLAIELAINLGMKIKLAGKIDFQSEGYFEEEVEKYFAHPLVEYLGELDFDQKVALLSHAKCNLHPTGFREPFGLTVLEAAYCGTPTLAIARGSMPELIEEGRTGLLVEDFVEGYHHIEECFAMDRVYIANRARRLFNYRIMTSQYLTAYDKVLTIFNTLRDQEEAIRQLTHISIKELDEIWRMHERQRGDI
jgi:glycosyltransferase involved in cell wall biosynthesis